MCQRLFSTHRLLRLVRGELKEQLLYTKEIRNSEMSKLIDTKLVNIPRGNEMYCLRCVSFIEWKSIIFLWNIVHLHSYGHESLY